MKDALIYLVGFMGVGKSSVGQCLAGLLGWDFIDLDQEIEKQEGKCIRDLFRENDEAYFRAIERRELQRVSTLSRHVVAMGGGAFCSPENRRIVDATGTSVWLDAPLDLIFRRCEGDPSRPLFTNRPEVEMLLESRRPYYSHAVIRVDVAGLTVDAVAKRILRELAVAGARHVGRPGCRIHSGASFE